MRSGEIPIVYDGKEIGSVVFVELADLDFNTSEGFGGSWHCKYCDTEGASDPDKVTEADLIRFCELLLIEHWAKRCKGNSQRLVSADALIEEFREPG